MSAFVPQITAGAFMQTAFERFPTGLIVVDEAGKMALVNRAVELQFGYERDELLGQPVEILVPGDLAAKHEKVRAHYATIPAAHRAGIGRELLGRHKDGRQIPVEIGLMSLSVQEGSFVLATIADVRERHQKENRLRQPHKLEALGSLASGIANDFNNILLGVMGYAEQARAVVGDRPSAVADLDVVLNTVRRGQELVNRILAFARTTDPVRTDTDPAEPTREAIRLLRTTLPSSIEIHEGIDPDIPHVMADSSELRQIVMNLATNATQAMHAQGGVLDICLVPVMVDKLFLVDHPGMREGLHVHLTVSDTGVGVHPEDIGHIYEPFFTTKPSGEGSGLGLAVVDQIVQSLGGTIEVRSRVGEGTRFDIYIPSVSVDSSPARDDRRSGSGRRNILVAEHEGSRARLGQRLLESAGFEVTAHTSGLRALESFQANPQHFDLLITDSKMPDMTGLELVDRIMAIRPTLPVLMVSGTSKSVTVDLLKLRGVTRVLRKPRDPAVLVDAVREILAPGSA